MWSRLKQNRRLVLLLILGLFVLILVLILNLVLPTKPGQTPSQQQKPYSSPKQINSQGDLLFLENENYKIVYLPNFTQYNISILSSPFNYYREQAEKEFLSLFGINQQQACSLNVVITTPRFANPEESGKEYMLSFCLTPTPLPPIAINPELKELQTTNIYPSPGLVAYSQTTNAIYVTFNQPINPATFIVNINPLINKVLLINPQNPTELIISPTSNWQNNQDYQIEITAGGLSQDGVYQLKKPINFSYTTVLPVFPSPPSHGI